MGVTVSWCILARWWIGSTLLHCPAVSADAFCNTLKCVAGETVSTPARETIQLLQISSLSIRVCGISISSDLSLVDYKILSVTQQRVWALWESITSIMRKNSNGDLSIDVCLDWTAAEHCWHCCERVDTWLYRILVDSVDCIACYSSIQLLLLHMYVQFSSSTHSLLFCTVISQRNRYTENDGKWRYQWLGTTL